MSSAVRTRVKLDTRRLKKKVNKASFKSLGHAGAAIKLTARRSIRRRKRPSKPGSPPHTPTGALKRVLRHDVNESKQQAVIGPVNEYARTIWHLHEFGGTLRPRARLLKQTRFRVGQFGPVRRSGKKFTRARLLTEAQARRATQLVQEENDSRRQNARGTRRYPARPFMRPALLVNRPRLPRFWENSVR